MPWRAPDDLPVKPFASAAAWEEWLAQHHGSADGIWLKLAKKGSGIESLTFPEALEAALCHGWIDGQRRGFDDDYYLQRFTPRRARSKWSKINCDSATALIEAGRMRPAGLEQVERAKADGRWDAAYDSPSRIQVPPDLERALVENPRAGELFGRLDSQNRYAILYRIHDAKRPETRARRIEEFVTMLAEGRKPYP
ncbi:MAG TPA: YdeI/OmpD-associated family protein [Gaiellaceae bacterium]